MISMTEDLVAVAKSDVVNFSEELSFFVGTPAGVPGYLCKNVQSSAPYESSGEQAAHAITR